MTNSNISNDSKPAEGKEIRRRTTIAFSALILLFSCITAFYFRIIPVSWDLFVVPQFFLLLTLVTPLLLWQSLSSAATSKRISVIGSAVIWVLGILAAFAFKPPSPFISISDGMLLLGFFPLLYLWRFSLPWIFFGAFNLAIGIFLLLLTLLNDSYFPQQLWVPKHHLAEFHPYMMWLLAGAASLLFGVLRLAKNMIFMALRMRTANRNN